MARVTREMVERAGVDVDQLLELLVKNAAAELTTYYYYTILRANLIGLQGESLKEIAEVARIEDRNHFEALVPRIYELGGKLPQDMVEFHNLSACPPGQAPRGPHRRDGDPEGAGGGGALCGAGLYPHLQPDRREGPPHLRPGPGDPERGDRARILVLGVPGRGPLGPLHAPGGELAFRIQVLEG